jgi:hypothetical protein
MSTGRRREASRPSPAAALRSCDRSKVIPPHSLAP